MRVRAVCPSGWFALAAMIAVSSLSGRAFAQDQPVIPSVLVLDTSDKNGALNLGGDNVLTVRKGNLIVNSSDNLALFNANSTLAVQDGTIQIVGGYSDLGQASTTPVPQTCTQPVADPLAKRVQYPEDAKVRERQKLIIPDNRHTVLEPGYYLGGISALGKDVQLTLNPGVYVIWDGDFFVSAADMDGQGVTIVMAGQHPGKLTFGDGSRVRLQAPSEGALQGILLFSKGAAEGNSSDIGFNGADCVLRGTIYAPRGRVGVFAKSRVRAGHVVCFNLMMNTGAELEVLGVPALDPAWEKIGAEQ
jgi:hypothetical protein